MPSWCGSHAVHGTERALARLQSLSLSMRAAPLYIYQSLLHAGASAAISLPFSPPAPQSEPAGALEKAAEGVRERAEQGAAAVKVCSLGQPRLRVRAGKGLGVLAFGTSWACKSTTPQPLHHAGCRAGGH